MAIVIGLVIHASGRRTFHQAASTLCGVTLEWVTYEYERDIRAGVERLLADKHVDGLLLGLMPYTECRALLPPDLQVTVTRPAPLDLALMLGRAANRGWPMTPVSIDTYDPGIVDEVADALGLDMSAIARLPYTPDQSVAEILRFHNDFVARNPDGYVITMRTAVARGLTCRAMTTELVVSTVRGELHELALRIESERANAQRFAAGVFFVSKQDGGVDLDRARVRLMNLLVETPGFGDAWIENRGRRGVVVFAHKALFERVTGNWVSVPTLAHAGAVIGQRVVAGFGVGASARNCVLLAERAAARADQETSPCGYLIEDSGLMIGPMSSVQPPLSFAYREHTAELEAVARDAGLSAVTLARLAALERSLRGRPIAPSDLADSLGITDPSGRRLIRKLVASGLVSQEGTTQTNRKGRPTRLYRLSIDNAVDARRDPR
nr:helix-turn-helix domain-containing protein [Kibdelosporangium sp. MJ126-NF4]